MSILDVLFGRSKKVGRLRRTTGRYGQKGSFRHKRGSDVARRGKGGKFR